MPKLVQKVLGLDFNALYLHSLMQEMPVGMPEWWKVENGRLLRQSATMDEKLKERFSHGEVEYLKYREWRDGIRIHTAMRGQQFTVGKRQYRADGYSKFPRPTVYNYNGCHFHQHQAGCLRPPQNFHVNAHQRRQQDAEQEAKLKSDGITVITIWECEFNMVKKAAKQLQRGQSCDPRFKSEALKYQQYLRLQQPRPFQNQRDIDPKEMLRAILDNRVFGFVKLDIFTPDHLKELHEDFPLICKHADITLQDLGPYMERVATENNCFKKPKDALIGSYFGEGIWLMTPLVIFYHRQGLEIRQIYEVVQCDRRNTFQWFGETVTDYRTQGDLSKDKAILAEVWKLMGNSAYGKCITNLRKHLDVIYADTPELERYHNEPRHKRSVAIDEDAYEIQNRKERITFNLPMVVGLAVYNYAKLKMISFICDVLLVYFSKDDYMFLESDTDSIYLCLSADTLEEVVRADKRAEWDRIKGKWFVQEASQKRTPGLLKVEKEADNFIGLCSKCYICSTGDETSVRAKGAQPRNSHIFTLENFRRVLFSLPGAQRIAFNMGIRSVGNDVVTYIQEKQGLTPVYCKRICLSTGYTLPLKI